MTTNKEFTLSRICIFARCTIDPDSDVQVRNILHDKFGIRLPQRRTIDESLLDCTSDHEIVSLILKYRAMK